MAPVYADIHRLSHQIGAAQPADLAHLAQARSEPAEIQARQAAALRRQARDLDALGQELAVLPGMAGEAEALRALQELPVCLGELEPCLGRLEQERERARTQAMDWRHRCEASEARILVLKTDLTERAAEARVVEALLLRDLAPSCDAWLEGDWIWSRSSSFVTRASEALAS